MDVAAASVDNVLAMRLIWHIGDSSTETNLFCCCMNAFFMIAQISEDSSLLFSGPYCQYNPLNCPLARDDSGAFKPCAGRLEKKPN